MTDEALARLVQHINKHAFTNTKETLKVQRAALNCISNILN